jgi:hypothetical protein
MPVPVYNLDRDIEPFSTAGTARANTIEKSDLVSSVVMDGVSVSSMNLTEKYYNFNDDSNLRSKRSLSYYNMDTSKRCDEKVSLLRLIREKSGNIVPISCYDLDGDPFIAWITTSLMSTRPGDVIILPWISREKVFAINQLIIFFLS